jgi:hypothetical protein
VKTKKVRGNEASKSGEYDGKMLSLVGVSPSLSAEEKESSS